MRRTVALVVGTVCDDCWSRAWPSPAYAPTSGRSTRPERRDRRRPAPQQPRPPGSAAPPARPPPRRRRGGAPGAGRGAPGRRGDRRRSAASRSGTVDRVARLLGDRPRRADALDHLPLPGRLVRQGALQPRGAAARATTVTVADPTGTEVYRYDAAELLADAVRPVGDVGHRRHRRGRAAPRRGRPVGSRLDRRRRAASTRSARGSRRAAAGRASAPAARARRTGREESVCGSDDKSDAVCYRVSRPGRVPAVQGRRPAADQRHRAVHRLAGRPDATGCSPTTTASPTPTDAYDTEVWFNYQCAQCGGFEVFRPTKVWGDQVLATDRDARLHAVHGRATSPRCRSSATWSWTRAAPAAARSSTSRSTRRASRPGSPRAATRTAPATARSSTRRTTGTPADSDVSYYCDTEGGSSGSPVLSRRTGQGGRAAPLRRLPQLRRPRRPDPTAAAEPADSPRCPAPVAFAIVAIKLRPVRPSGWWFDALLARRRGGPDRRARPGPPARPRPGRRDWVDAHRPDRGVLDRPSR